MCYMTALITFWFLACSRSKHSLQKLHFNTVISGNCVKRKITWPNWLSISISVFSVILTLSLVLKKCVSNCRKLIYKCVKRLGKQEVYECQGGLYYQWPGALIKLSCSESVTKAGDHADLLHRLSSGKYHGHLRSWYFVEYLNIK